MNLQLISTKATDIKFTKSISNEQNDKEVGFTFKLANAFTTDESNTFFVIFKFSMNLEESMSLEVEYQGEFELDTIITDKFRHSSFPIVNAPAIAYPYARAFISNLLLNAGYEPTLLPSVNFVALNKQHQSQE